MATELKTTVTTVIRLPVEAGRSIALPQRRPPRTLLLLAGDARAPSMDLVSRDMRVYPLAKRGPDPVRRRSSFELLMCEAAPRPILRSGTSSKSTAINA